MSTLQLVLLIVAGLIVIAIVAGLIGRHYVRKGASEPVLVKLVNQISDRVIDTVRHPITVAVLDEVADVLRTGHYTKNIAAALRENQEEIKAMVAEKVMADPSTKAIGLVPFHERIINQVSETVLRVIFEVLADPRTEELVNDMLRDNIVQLRQAVRAREHEKLDDLEPPDDGASQYWPPS